MLDLTRVPEDFYEPAARVVETVLEASGSLTAGDVMLVGAWSRNILHRALGHTFETTATRDIDLALALASWDAYRALATAFTAVGHAGLRYRIAGFDVDLLPFGAIEDPEGVVEPPSREVPFSVWAFGEIFATSLPLALSHGLEVRIPTVAGFAGAKMGAWLDRSVGHETKDAADLALVLYWYAESQEVQDRLYDSSAGNDVLIAEEADVQRAAAHLLGTDVAELIGPRRHSELLARWPGDAALLTRNLQLRGGPAWPADFTRRRELVDALTRGLTPST
jgi:predicted nucleotidyltransferase